MRGQSSHSSRVSTFLLTASALMSTFKNLAGSCNVSSDFASGNTPECLITNCQICNFTNELQIAIVHLVNVDEIIRGTSKMSFITRSTWLSTQVDCPDLRIFSHILSQGTCPSKKLSNMKDRKDYLNCCTIARYGMLVVPHHEPSSPTTEGILVPKHILAGLPTPHLSWPLNSSWSKSSVAISSHLTSNLPSHI